MKGERRRVLTTETQRTQRRQEEKKREKRRISWCSSLLHFSLLLFSLSFVFSVSSVSLWLISLLTDIEVVMISEPLFCPYCNARVGRAEALSTGDRAKLPALRRELRVPTPRRGRQRPGT